MDTQQAKDILLKGSVYENLFQLGDRHITFALIEFTAQKETKLLSTIESVATLSAEYGAVIDTIVSNLMVVTFGMFGPTTPHKPFIDAALTKHGIDIRIVYATGSARVGNIGDAKRISYTFLHPSFSKAIALLPSTPAGEAREVV